MKIYTYLLAAVFLLSACGDNGSMENGKTPDNDGHAGEHTEEVHITSQQFKALDMKVGTLPLRNMHSYVEANGELEVPPQNEATVTAVIGANVVSIGVIEGDRVSKGDPLAHLSHPDLVKLQSEYVNDWNRLQFLEKEYSRQKRLYEEEVSSGKDFERTRSEYLSTSGKVRGYEAQLRLLGFIPGKIRQDKFYEKAPVTSPIDGYIRKVGVKTGQYVEPRTEMFEIVNLDHIHADLMVFEKDMHRISEGQKVIFTTESAPDKELEASIYAVGKSFEQDPKAIHIHAEIENKEGLLIPGMYVRGRILTDNHESHAMPEEGVAREGDRTFVFSAEKQNPGGATDWSFKPLEVITGTRDDGWIEVKLLKELDDETQLALNNAYYLMAELKKGEAGHSH